MIRCSAGKCKRLRTNATFEHFFARMFADMISQAFGGQECFDTMRTRKTAMLQMGLHVTVDAIFAFKRTRTNRTVKAVVLRMGDHVPFQQCFFHELGRTLRAIDWPATKQEECMCLCQRPCPWKGAPQIVFNSYFTS